MFWKYIEKINWIKVFHHFLGMKYKAIEIQITYFGTDAFEIGGGWSRHKDHAGPNIQVTILGVFFEISIMITGIGIMPKIVFILMMNL